MKSKLQHQHPITRPPFKKYEWHKYIETCIHTIPLSIKLTIHVLDKRKIAALWRAEITAMTAWRLFRSKSFWKTRENFQLLHINLCSIGKNDSNHIQVLFKGWNINNVQRKGDYYLSNLYKVSEYICSSFYGLTVQNLLLYPEIHLQ